MFCAHYQHMDCFPQVLPSYTCIDISFDTVLLPNIEETLHVRLLDALHTSLLKLSPPKSCKLTERGKPVLVLPETPCRAISSVTSPHSNNHFYKFQLFSYEVRGCSLHIHHLVNPGA